MAWFYLLRFIKSPSTINLQDEFVLYVDGKLTRKNASIEIPLLAEVAIINIISSPINVIHPTIPQSNLQYSRDLILCINTTQTCKREVRIRRLQWHGFQVMLSTKQLITEINGWMAEHSTDTRASSHISQGDWRWHSVW